MVKARPHLSGWRRAWPPDARAVARVEGCLDGTTLGMSARDWFASEPLRRLLASEDLPMTGRRILASLGETALDKLPMLQAGGIVYSAGRGPLLTRWGLSKDGRHSIGWSGAPKPEGVRERGAIGRNGIPSWAAQLSSAIAEHYGCDVHEMLHGEVGACVLARARLCAALWARGWTVGGVASYFAMRPEWVRSGIARWRRAQEAA